MAHLTTAPPFVIVLPEPSAGKELAKLTVRVLASFSMSFALIYHPVVGVTMNAMLLKVNAVPAPG